MQGKDLEKGKIYKLIAGDFAQFSRVTDSGFAACHSLGQRDDGPDAFTIDPKHVVREATEEEADRCYKAAGMSRPKPYEPAPVKPVDPPKPKKPKDVPPPESVTEVQKPVEDAPPTA